MCRPAEQLSEKMWNSDEGEMKGQKDDRRGEKGGTDRTQRQTGRRDRQDAEADRTKTTSRTQTERKVRGQQRPHSLTLFTSPLQEDDSVSEIKPAGPDLTGRIGPDTVCLHLSPLVCLSV